MGEPKLLDLMAMLVHELKSPVSTVHATAEAMHNGYYGPLNPEQQKGLEAIMRNCHYLEDFIRCYTDLSKMELGGSELKKRRINLVSDVVEAVVEMVGRQASLKKMPIVVEGRDRVELLGDPGLLMIAIHNLMDNAIKYGAPSSEIHIKVFGEDGQAVFSIRNEGVGIAKEAIQEKLFRRFGRLKQKGAEGVKGSGLGLYICKRIIDMHGGRIEVASEVGSFAEFRVYLDLAP